MNKHVTGIVTLFILTLAAGAYGIYVVGSPVSQQLVNADNVRIRDIQQIQSSINSYHHDIGSLPETLQLLQDAKFPGGSRPYLSVIPIDPETKKEYEYLIKNDLQYELCATFATDSEEIKAKMKSFEVERYYDAPVKHIAGYDCVSASVRKTKTSSPLNEIIPPALPTTIPQTKQSSGSGMQIISPTRGGLTSF